MKRVVVFVTLVAAIGAACKQGPHPTAGTGTTTTRETAHAETNAVPPAPLAHPLFWSVEKAGKTTYFLGTMHTGVDAETRLPAIVWNTFHRAKTFAMETNLDDPQAASLLQPTRRSLHQDLGDDYWKKLEDAMGPSVAGALDHLPPMVSASTLAMRGLPLTTAMDKVLSAHAASEHKALVFLEPVTRQLAILDKWMDVKALKMMLDELPGNEQRAQAMLDAYLEGDEHKIIATSDHEKDDALQHGYTAAEYDQEMDELLYHRNASWIDAIEKLHAEGGGFVAVGAMHLLGPRSVLELLAHQGYQVTRIAP
ncbi:MAG TPA: TraB/GumN family protein [Kofleriaceae bacterium]|jgi:hypothetical protein|nr:TraB/GumN family protein [Kofleriaceae bacterium]